MPRQESRRRTFDGVADYALRAQPGWVNLLRTGRVVILSIPDPHRFGIKHSKRQGCNSKSGCSTAQETNILIVLDFRKQSAHFANEQPPMPCGFRSLEAQEGLFKLSQKFEYFVLSHPPRRYLFFDAGKRHFD